MKRGSEHDLITSDAWIVHKWVGIKIREKMYMIHLFIQQMSYLSVYYVPAHVLSSERSPCPY